MTNTKTALKLNLWNAILSNGLVERVKGRVEDIPDGVAVFYTVLAR